MAIVARLFISGQGFVDSIIWKTSIENRLKDQKQKNRARSCSSGSNADQTEEGDCPVDAAFGRPMKPGCCKISYQCLPLVSAG